MSINELIFYRISRAKETFDEAKILAENNHWNAVANRLYYACFYIVNALLIQHKLNFKSHNAVKKEFHKSFIKTGLISLSSGKTYSRLFNLRQEGDYVDFKRFEENDIKPFISDTQNLIFEIEEYISSK